MRAGTMKFFERASHPTETVMMRNFSMSGKIHIAGVVVHARPQLLQSVREAIAALDSVEVHGASAEGKLAVTVETESPAEVLSRIDTIQQIEGVLSAAIVYEHSEEIESLTEEISNESHAPGIY